jgi:hypothetical protein
MQKVKAVKGFVASGVDKFFVSCEAAVAYSLRQARYSKIKNGVGNKWYSDLIGALVDNPELMKK